jgi:hypothetical protein
MQGDKPLSKMGFMSPQFKALAASQDLIGWRNFTEGHISTHFYAIQSFHLAMSSSYLNGEDWTKQFISRNLQITHSQWIFQKVSLHNRTHGYLHNQKAEEILQQINVLSDLAPEEVPKASQFFLEVNFSKLSKSHLETQKVLDAGSGCCPEGQGAGIGPGGKSKTSQAEAQHKDP